MKKYIVPKSMIHKISVSQNPLLETSQVDVGGTTDAFDAKGSDFNNNIWEDTEEFNRNLF